MSRFVECLQTLGPVTLGSLENILDHLKDRLQAEKAFLQLNFPYFIYKTAPVSGQRAPLDIDCVYTAEKDEQFSLRISAEIPIQTLCPARKRSALMALITKELWLNWKLDLLKWFGLKNWLLLLMQEQARLFTVF